MRAVIDWLEAPPHQKSCRTRPSSASANREGRREISGVGQQTSAELEDAYLGIMAVADVFISRSSPEEIPQDTLTIGFPKAGRTTLRQLFESSLFICETQHQAAEVYADGWSAIPMLSNLLPTSRNHMA